MQINLRHYHFAFARIKRAIHLLFTVLALFYAEILDLDIKKLRKSSVFPYGLTEDKISKLKAKGYMTVGQLAESTEEELRQIDRIGVRTVERIKNVVEQAIWM